MTQHVTGKLETDTLRALAPEEAHKKVIQTAMMPLFIGGCGRSGTTLLGAMLGAHTECLTVPESQFKIDVLPSYAWDKGNADIQQALSMIKNHWRFQLWGLDIEPDSVPEEEPGISYRELIEWIVAKYGKKIGKVTSRFWVDHTPSNIRFAATLFELFPEAKMIHIVRDGRAVAASIMPLAWGPNTIGRAAHYWVEKVAYGLAAESCWERDRIIRIRYEDLVLDPEVTLESVCSFLGIDYQSEMTKANGFIVPRYTSDQHSLIGRAPDRKRVTAWQRELTPRQIEIFESLTDELLRYLGYPVKYGLKARKMTRMEKLGLEIQELFRRQVVNKWRKRARRSGLSK